MKKIRYIFLVILGIAIFNSCEKTEKEVDLIPDGVNLVVFQNYTVGFGVLADGTEYTRSVFVKLTGPALDNVTDDITVKVKGATKSTAIENQHYKILTPTITLKKDNNYMGIVEFVILTEGNTPPMDGTPEFDLYKSPILYLEISEASGASNVIPSGKLAKVSLNLTPPNPYAGDYDVILKYFHPTAGGTYPTEPYGGVRELEKTLLAVSGRKCESIFGVWTDLCWITINANNTIAYEVADTWTYDVQLGDPNDATKVSHFDPETGIIYLYYHYYGTGGPRIFWEEFHPKAKK